MSSNGSDDEMDWEEVVPGESALQPGDVVVEFQDVPDSTGPSANVALKGKGGGRKLDEAERARINAERAARLQSHKIHTVALLANASIRNKWLNDPLLHARLMSLTPLSLQNHFDMITKKNQPDKALRGRQFEAALIRLSKWWNEEFEVDSSSHKNVRSRTFTEVQKKLQEEEEVLKARKGKAKSKDKEDEDEDGQGEVIRSSKSFMKHALMMRGSRDTSAQLFTALCRALGLPCRLVVSIQSVPWKATVGKKPSKPKPKVDPDPKGKGKAVEAEEGSSGEESMEEVFTGPPTPYQTLVKGKGKGKATNPFPGAGNTLNGQASTPRQPAKPTIHLRRAKPSGRRLGGHPTAHHGPPSGGWPPVYWTEVFSRPDGRWLPIDPIRNFVNKRKRFEPPPYDRNNRMVYVVALEEDGYGRDVTRRYAQEFGAKTAKIQMGGSTNKGDWWDSICQMITRPFRLHRDDVEDAELMSNQMTEGMPQSVAGFKSHPLYILQQHLRREQVIHPPTIIGHFRGEPVYPRENVVELKTAENWMRSEGREVKQAEQPLKEVKIRAMTTARKRAVEMAAQLNADGDGVMQGMYAEWQTRVYVPPPVVNGKVPKNDFGNIDLYTPSMLPEGAVHLPYKGIAKVARKLGMDYAEAVTGFEFKQRRALPILGGVVVAVENEETLLEAYWATAQAAEEKERQKKEERVFKRWKKLVNSLRIRERLMKEYSVGGPGAGQKVQLPDTAGTDYLPDEVGGGGFLLNKTDMDVVQRYSLPKMLHPVVNHAVAPRPELGPTGMEGLTIEGDEDDEPTAQEDEDDRSPWGVAREDGMLQEASEPGSPLPPRGRPIKTMEDLAGEIDSDAHPDEEGTPEAESTPPSPAKPLRPRRSVAAPKKSDASTRRTRGSTSKPYPASATPATKRTRGKRRKSSVTSSEEEAVSEPEDESDAGPSKRSRRGPSTKRSKLTADETSDAPAPTPTRTLRARKGKTAEQLEAEKEQERAYRLAIKDG